jgi:hypothetical protein
MTTALGITTMALGAAYVTLAGVALIEVLGGFRARGFSRFGVGLVVMGLACGAHHIVHGLHAVTGGGGSAPAMIATLVGLPAVLTFIALRVEVMTGGRGDRFIAGTPRWISLTPIGFLIVAGVLLDRSLQNAFESPTLAHHGVAEGISWWVMLPNLFIALSYALVGWYLLRTQVRRREEQGGWSLSGLALGAVFPTCSLMHLAVALDQPQSSAVVGLDLVGVPISIYFLWVVNGLYRQALVDWNRRPLAGDPGRPDRMSPWDHPGATAV